MDRSVSRNERSEGREFLRRFASGGDEEAFRRVVEIFGGMVHGVALRKTGAHDAAEEVAQRVFIVLAQKAPAVARAVSVGAWLHRAAVLESLKVIREKRMTQERLAMIRNQMQTDDEGSARWKDVLPHLDDAFDRLKEEEREVLMMRYLEGRTFPEVGAQLSVTPEAARKRSERALARLAGFLRGRGVVVPAAVLASGLTAEFAKAASASLVGSISAAALSAPIPVVTTTLGQSILTTMQTGKLSMVAAVLIGAAIPVGVEVAKGSAQREQIRTSASDVVLTAPDAASAKGSRIGKAAEPITEERLRAVFQKLEAGEEIDADLELSLRRMVFTFDAAELDIARRLLGEVEKHERFLEISQAVFARWAELDPEAAITAASAESTRYGYYPLHGAFGTWTVTDSEAALKWLVTASTPFDLKFMGYEWLRRVAAHDAEKAVEVLKGMVAGKSEWTDPMHWALVEGWGKHDPEAALEWVLQIDGPQREESLEDLVKAAGELTPEIALRAAEHMETRARKIEALWEVVWWWALDRPDDLIRYAGASEQFGSLEPESLRAIGEGLARNRPAAVMDLAERIEDGERRNSYLSGVLRGVTEADPAHFVAAAEAIPDDYVRREASGDFARWVRSWFERDAEAARIWVEALPAGRKRELAMTGIQLGAPLRGN